MIQPLLIFVCFSLASSSCLAPKISATKLALKSPSEAARGIAPQAAREPQPVQATVGLYVDTSSVEQEFRAQLDYVVTHQLAPALEGAGYEVADGSVDLIVQVRFAPLEGGEAREYGLHFELFKGAVTQPLIQWVHCAKCSQNQLTKKLRDATPAVLAALADELESEAPTTGGSDDHHVEDGGVEAPRNVKAMGLLGGVGLGVAALGMGATIAGAVELSRGKIYDMPTTRVGERTFVDHRVPGAVLLGAGAAGLLAGAAMIITDVVTRDKRRHQQRARAAHPVLGPGVLGVGYIQRF